MSDFQKQIIFHLKRILGRITIKEEVSCKKLFPEYHSQYERYDIVIPTLELIIEAHGEHHEQIVQYGGLTLEDAQFLHNHTKIRDRSKQWIAEENEWGYIIIFRSEFPNKEKDQRSLIHKELQEALKGKVD